MADGLNRATLIGNLGEDPTLRYTSGNTPVLTLRMATSASYYDEKKKERVEQTEWHTVVIWGARAEALGKILTKGFRLYVEGAIVTRSWEKDGVKRYATEIKASNVLLMGSARGGRADAGGAEAGADESAKGGDDDIPF